ncbi:phospholipid/cholesterol/gamma-HCH transport system substrate-binding protein [Kibdelosporangium banguiense]|uniref:Phospholipid/cholesterol/gamma-HCH transport system substrate-binding protein n=1 Tax=Kibdelosporangium banguiense TaxID=1365924 RepID=A0ABS4TMC6_9PSEU|nr:MCE family protein [Kibdelosporangium banguiense]MBP2325499.1 phospholipid/cholesterol/gamma-HCH transport system substrate-binding protein [Kibdelosporangium banguiense]
MRVLLPATVLVSVLLVSGCGAGGFNGVYNLPLPGGADLGDHPYRVRVQFADVLDLVPQAGVKVNDVPVGRVDQIDVGEDGWTAEVVLLVNGDVALPANAAAAVRQSSLLGEKFVELRAPTIESASGKLADNAVIPRERTNRNAEIEEVFGAMSMLLNGGGVAQFQQIAREVNNALEGNETGIRSLLSNMDSFIGELDTHRNEITRALTSLNRLAATVSAQRGRISGVLQDLGPGLGVLTQQREELVGMLKSLDHLSAVAVDTVKQSKDDIVADLKALAPTLQALADAGEKLPQSFELLLTYPFTDIAGQAIKGDYLNAFVELPPPSSPPDPDAPAVPLRPMDAPVLPGGGR